MLGYEVDAINSVQFSNHTQYEHVTGGILKSEELTELVNGLRKNELLPAYSHLLTGEYNCYLCACALTTSHRCNFISDFCTIN